MPEPVKCEICGKECDPRGLAGHKRMAHNTESSENGGESGRDDNQPVTVDRESVDIEDGELEEALPGASVTEDTITFRSIQEIEVADEEMKRELLTAIKEQFIQGGSVQI